MADINSTQFAFKHSSPLPLAMVNSIVQHEKKSCLLSQLSPLELLLLNGSHIQIECIDSVFGISYQESGTVLSVLIPSQVDSIERGILFLPFGNNDPYFPDINRTSLLSFGPAHI